MHFFLLYPIFGHSLAIFSGKGIHSSIPQENIIEKQAVISMRYKKAVNFGSNVQYCLGNSVVNPS